MQRPKHWRASRRPSLLKMRRSTNMRSTTPSRPIGFLQTSIEDITVSRRVVSHFDDTMATKGHRYFIAECLTFGSESPDQAINNADSVAGYVIYNV
ncbi:hypothetical protein HAV18_26840 [Burkholderia sp. D-99]|nr:hypothetical protein [Burkholderia sp. D-99]